MESIKKINLSSNVRCRTMYWFKKSRSLKPIKTQCGQVEKIITHPNVLMILYYNDNFLIPNSQDLQKEASQYFQWSLQPHLIIYPQICCLLQLYQTAKSRIKHFNSCNFLIQRFFLVNCILCSLNWNETRVVLILNKHTCLG